MDKFLSCKSLTKRKTTDNPQTISREVSASKKKQKRVDFTGWKEENLQLYPWLVKKPCSDSVCGFKLYCKHCLDYPQSSQRVLAWLQGIFWD